MIHIVNKYEYVSLSACITCTTHTICTTLFKNYQHPLVIWSMSYINDSEVRFIFFDITDGVTNDIDINLLCLKLKKNKVDCF